MEEPSINNTQAVFQAGTTIGTYLSQAIHEIDSRFGDGYARSHPDLLSGCVQAQALDYATTAISAAIYGLCTSLDDIDQSLSSGSK